MTTSVLFVQRFFYFQGMNKKLIIIAISCFCLIVLLRIQGAALITAQTPSGILDLEFANSPVKLFDALAAWDSSVVKQNIWIDFLFIPTYVLLLSLLSSIFSYRWIYVFFSKGGAILARAAFLAGFLDIAENLLMLQSIAGNYTPSSLWLTYYCASIKFSIVICILLYIVISLPVLFKKNNSNGS